MAAPDDHANFRRRGQQSDHMADIVTSMDFSRPLSCISPALEGDILFALAQGDQELTGRQVEARLPRGSHAAVLAALDRLAAQGVIHRRPAGRAHLFSLNRDHIACPAILDLAGMRQRLIDRFRDAVKHWQIRPASVVWFGSTARGEGTVASDLDILVIAPIGGHLDERWESQLMDLQQQATRWTGNDTRILEFAEDELPALSQTEPVLAEAAREGVHLTGRRLATLLKGCA